jgi:flavorubredoxin
MSTSLGNNIDWVGYIDWTIRDFHSYDTERGATYNAYLVRDEKTALIDTVKAPYADGLLRNITVLCPLEKIDYLVCNHAEPDHSGSLPQVLAAAPQAVLVCDKKCAEILAENYDTSAWKMTIVASGDAVSLGRRTLQFIETPMVHWPESMFTYVAEEKLLFSMDAFGQHYASAERFDDQSPLDVVMDEAKTYYANIIMPYGKSAKACLERIGDLAIETIAPSHGVIWRKHVKQILDAYRRWMVCTPEPKVLVIYDSMWDSTGEMARAILDGAAQSGATAKLLHLRRTNLTRLASEVLDAAGVAFGSSTLNRTMMPAAAAALCYLEGLNPRGKLCFAFGSYGWGKGGAEDVNEGLKRIGWEIVCEPIRAKYRPTAEVLDACRRAGKMLGEKAAAVGGMREAR